MVLSFQQEIGSEMSHCTYQAGCCDFAARDSLRAEIKEDLKSLLMKVKEETEKTGLNLNIQKNNIMAFGPIAAATAAKTLQSYPTLCDPIDGSPLGSAVLGILQARTLKWVVISFYNA